MLCLVTGLDGSKLDSDGEPIKSVCVEESIVLRNGYGLGGGPIGW